MLQDLGLFHLLLVQISRSILFFTGSESVKFLSSLSRFLVNFSEIIVLRFPNSPPPPLKTTQNKPSLPLRVQNFGSFLVPMSTDTLV